MRLVEKFNFVKNLIQDMVEIEASTRGMHAKGGEKAATTVLAKGGAA
jgi:hypothetical protein